MMCFERDVCKDALWHIFTTQSKKHPKITHLWTQINHLAHWTHPAGHAMPHPATYI